LTYRPAYLLRRLKNEPDEMLSGRHVFLSDMLIFADADWNTLPPGAWALIFLR
jgi:hypothetical protein